MSQPIRREAPTACPGAILWLVVLAGAFALLATYWDDGWHTVHGRDNLLIPPHVLLYGSIGAIGISTTAWVIIALRAARSMGILFQISALSLATVGVGITLAGAPIDDLWHRSFGRDAVAWSPPHMLGLVGTGAIAIAALIESSRPGRGNLIQPANGAMVLGVLSAAVFEYETEVPQFGLVWYLPVAGATLMLGLFLLDSLRNSSWVVTYAALLFEGLRGAISMVLVLAGFSAGVIPIILPSAFLFDLCRHLGLARPVAATLSGLVFVVIQVVYLRLIPAGFDLTANDALIAAAAVAVSIVVLGALFSNPKARSVAIAVSVTALLVAMEPTQRAFAHDPGQGVELIDVRLAARSSDREVAVTATILDANSCGLVDPAALVARRAGQTVRAVLSATGVCAFGGSMSLPERGLWFVYVEGRQSDMRLEAWLPIRVGSDKDSVSKSTSFYEAATDGTTTAQVASGVLLYVVATSVLLFGLRAVQSAAALRLTSQQ